LFVLASEGRVSRQGVAPGTGHPHALGYDVGAADGVQVVTSVQRGEDAGGIACGIMGGRIRWGRGIRSAATLPWFRDLYLVEGEATVIRTYESYLIPGTCTMGDVPPAGQDGHPLRLTPWARSGAGALTPVAEQLLEQLSLLFLAADQLPERLGVRILPEDERVQLRRVQIKHVRVPLLAISEPAQQIVMLS
jgi:hypothetical protein